LARARNFARWRDLGTNLRKGQTHIEAQADGKSRKTGTKITFHPDPTIFEKTVYSFDTLAQRLRELAFLNKGLKITLTDERSDKTAEFKFTGGISEFVKHLNRGKTTLHDSPIYIEGSAATSKSKSRCNTTTVTGKRLRLRQYDQHRRRRHAPSGFRSSLTRTINTFAPLPAC